MVVKQQVKQGTHQTINNYCRRKEVAEKYLCTGMRNAKNEIRVLCVPY